MRPWSHCPIGVGLADKDGKAAWAPWTSSLRRYLFPRLLIPAVSACHLSSSVVAPGQARPQGRGHGGIWRHCRSLHPEEVQKSRHPSTPTGQSLPCLAFSGHRRRGQIQAIVDVARARRVRLPRLRNEALLALDLNQRDQLCRMPNIIILALRSTPIGGAYHDYVQCRQGAAWLGYTDG